MSKVSGPMFKVGGVTEWDDLTKGVQIAQSAIL
jgi:hypothetical protein